MNSLAATSKPAIVCESHQKDIARLMGFLQMELDRHAQDSNARTWGHAGELGDIRSRMIDLVSLASGMERDEVEGSLAE